MHKSSKHGLPFQNTQENDLIIVVSVLSAHLCKTSHSPKTIFSHNHSKFVMENTVCAVSVIYCVLAQNPKEKEKC